MSLPFMIILGCLFLWTTAFSMTTKMPIRGLRNLGILGSYLVAVIMPFSVGMKVACMTWAVFGLLGGLLYFLYDLASRWKTPADEEQPPVSLSHFFLGQVAWPVMGPEAIEYLLCELGVLPEVESSASKIVRKVGTNSMNEDEARDLLMEHFAPYLRKSYEDVESLKRGQHVTQVEKPSGVTYLFEVSVIPYDEEDGLEVVGMVTEHNGRTFNPPKVQASFCINKEGDLVDVPEILRTDSNDFQECGDES